MIFGEKLARLRKEHNHTQEQLADLLEVSRQSVSKWESDLAFPETEKLVRIGELYGCSIDYLLKSNTSTADESIRPFAIKPFKERKSAKTVFGMPLYHIGRNAHGFFAIGIKARGVFSVGLLASGIFSLGLLSLGIISAGLLSLGLIAYGVLALGGLAIGSIALGLIALGAISIGLLSFGALAVGQLSAGALAIGKYIAIGDHANALIAIGKSEAAGSIYQHIGEIQAADIMFVKNWLDHNLPTWLAWANYIFQLIMP